MRVLVFGDSITQGYWAVEHGWVDRLRRYYDRLQTINPDIDEPSFFNLGISADTSEDVYKRIKTEIAARTRPHHLVKPVVIVQIGINDSAESGADREVRVELDNYKTNLQRIIDIIKDEVSLIVFVGFSACDESKTLPTSWGEFYYSNENIKKYEKVMEEIASKNKIQFIPVFDAFIEQLVKNKELLPDGLHPIDKGHEIIYDIVKEKIGRSLEEVLA